MNELDGVEGKRKSGAVWLDSALRGQLRFFAVWYKNVAEVCSKLCVTIIKASTLSSSRTVYDSLHQPAGLRFDVLLLLLPLFALLLQDIRAEGERDE